ncbi:ABC transporter permease [Pseudoxanthomonas wuyuanensis]|uniref:Iron(III) transport system permease protein n=1 Tax=Pseudoxanthomonas wuyuanensis TaxID=1073196 RepID=A0A286D720_9GAMM|nr:iron ABC transporter permease [Pseudoxanthomonas wuyuanensis]KAF1721103.1 iron ABC transporter permease [Pseudoxanthomonas wuyuanensis]SOD54461.1 iron(III) transport system permease protein [Pseudoxanthomonas wuyuanensis]
MTAARIGADRAWQAAALFAAAAAALPLLALAWQAAQGSAGLWSHIAVHVLPPAARNTLLLLSGVGVLTVALGTGSAWLVTAYDFPGRRAMAWALLLPLAVPTYIVAYAYLDLLHPLGPLQSALRAVLGIDDPRGLRLPDVRSLTGCILLLGFVLYPYVYLSTRAMFLTQAASLLEAARTLGVSRAALFHRVALPLARPAIAVGVVLALLETLNDIGASEFLGVQTLTVAVYTTWITRSDLPGAAQIALSMLAIVVALIAIERRGRRRQRYAAQQRPRPMQPLRLRGVPAAAALALAAVPVVIGFAVPTVYLLSQTLTRLRSVGGVSGQLLASLWNTLLVAALATALTLAAGLAVAWALRLAQARRRERLEAASLRVASMGYAVPGTVLAIGLLTPLAWFDSGMSLLARGFGAPPQMWLMGTLAALVIAYALRFLAIAAGSADAGLARIPLSLDQAARSLGRTSAGMLRSIHLPLLRPSLAAAALLVFVDAMKELPATLMLRPISFETLATWLYADAARGAYEEGAVAALLIVLAGLLPVILLARTGLRFGRAGEMR